MTTTVKLITHDRVVHADDAFAVAILRIAFGEVAVIRTRNPEILYVEAGKPDTFLLDVGGRYDPEQRLFDHHQPEGAGYRNMQVSPPEWPYATAGLVWKHYGAQAVRALHPFLNEEGVQELVQHIDDILLKYIDAVDCGVRLKTSGPSVSAIIGSFNSAWFEKEEDAFPLANSVAQVILSNFIKRHAGKVLARDKVRHAESRMDGRVLLLEECVPWVEVVMDEMPDVMFVVYPVRDESETILQWQLRAAANKDKTPRVMLPQAWGGLERNALARVSGERDAVFCHRSRHLAGAMSQEGVMHMADMAIREHVQSAELLAA